LASQPYPLIRGGIIPPCDLCRIPSRILGVLLHSALPFESLALCKYRSTGHKPGWGQRKTRFADV
jgi:hypothetical protein